MRNILLLTVDSLRADYLFGPDAPPSLTHLSRLAEEGVTFTSAYANAAYTKASFLSILSGTYPWMFESVQGGFGPERPHVAETLSDAGYATAGFHTNTYLSPTYNYDRGFDHYYGRDSGATGGESGGRLSRAYRSLVDRAAASRTLSSGIEWAYQTAGQKLGVQLGSSLYQPASELNDALVAWTRETDGPRFAWVHYMDVHTPYYPHEGTVSEDIDRRRAVQLFHRGNELRADASAAEIRELERLYRGEIEYLDEQVGDLLERVDETIGLNETVIVFGSDHGEAFGEHDHLYHPGSALYEENVHVPLIVSGPGIEPGTVDTPVSNVDIVPTMLANVGVDPPAESVGTDVTAFVSDPPEERLVFAEAYESEDGNVMVTDGRYKLLRELDTGSEYLFDTDADPGETRDACGEHPEVYRSLAATVDDHLHSVRHHDAADADIEVSGDVRLRLRRLGYDE
jgi:arylsulfatase A-like enzyme